MTGPGELWKPHVTVAAMIERGGRFLMVEERTPAGVRLNQPAGHWDPGETLLEAVVRETIEETGHRFVPQALVGIHHWEADAQGAEAYLRFVFAGESEDPRGEPVLDDEIIRTLWLTLDELRTEVRRLRGPQVLRACLDYEAGRRFPLSLLAAL